MTPTVQDVLEKMTAQLEAIAASVSALEAIIQSENYSGRQLTKQQFGEFVLVAKQDQKEVFGGLRTLIQSVSAK